MTKKHSIDFNGLVYIFIYLLIGVIALIKGPNYYPDSYAFLSMDFNRSPVYSLFLKFFTSIFGDNFEIPVIIVQYVFVVLAVSFLIKTLKTLFNLNVLSIILIQLFVLAPCAYLHFVSSTFLSEALSYPLFLLIFTLALKAFSSLNFKCLYKACPIIFILILTRGQFNALIPVFLLLSLYIMYKQHKFYKNIGIVILLLVIPFLTSITERVYNKAVFGYFVNNTMNYVHLISSGFYISDKEDIELFNNEDEKAYFKLVFESLRKAKLTRAQVIKDEKDDYEFYQQNFSNICNARIHELGLEYFKSKGLNYYEQNIALNNLCSKMFFPLLKNNFKKWIILFYKNLKNSFGSSKQMLLFLMLLIYALVQLWYTNSNLYKFIVLIILLMFANNVVIAAIVHSIKRYLFYFDWVLFSVIILFVNLISKKQLNEY